MGDVLMSCVVCSPDLPAFTVPLTPDGFGLLLGHMRAEHDGQWEHLPDTQLVHAHLAGRPERGPWQHAAPAQPVAVREAGA